MISKAESIAKVPPKLCPVIIISALYLLTRYFTEVITSFPIDFYVLYIPSWTLQPVHAE